MEGAFSQPNGGMCEKMLTWAKRMTRGSSEHDLLELYCGNGNFTIALAPNFRRDSSLGHLDTAACRVAAWSHAILCMSGADYKRC